MNERKAERLALLAAYFLLFGSVLWLAILTERQHDDTRQIVQQAEENIEAIEADIVESVCLDALVGFTSTQIIVDAIPDNAEARARLAETEDRWRAVCPAEDFGIGSAKGSAEAGVGGDASPGIKEE